jgi:hypothetical protein
MDEQKNEEVIAEDKVSKDDKYIQQLLEVVRDIQISQEKTHVALAHSLNTLTQRMDELEKVHIKIMGREVFYNAVRDTKDISNEVKLDLIMKIANYDKNKEEE